MKKNGYGQAKILSSAEINSLFTEGLRTPRDRALFGTCLYTACRIREACTLHKADAISPKGAARPSILIRGINTKGQGLTREIPTHPKLAKLLEAYKPRTSIYLFPGTRNNCEGFLHPQSADKILKVACQRIGIEGVSSHSFRRTALTNMANAGVPLRHIQEISGHKDLSVLQRYLEVSDEDKFQAIENLDFS